MYCKPGPLLLVETDLNKPFKLKVDARKTGAADNTPTPTPTERMIKEVATIVIYMVSKPSVGCQQPLNLSGDCRQPAS